MISLQNSALLVIDMQYDFMKGGSLEVGKAQEVIAPINQLLQLPWQVVVASKDWHPENHVSFAANHEGKKPFDLIQLPTNTDQVLWPVHCVQNTQGAEINTDLNTSAIDEVVLKGLNPKVDSYSAFFDNNHLEKTNLDEVLKSYNIAHLFIVGLARDYCVRYTALDGEALGYGIHFIWDATKPVDPNFDDKLIIELNERNIQLTDTAETLRLFKQA